MYEINNWGQNWKWPTMVSEHSDSTLFVSFKGMHLCSACVINRTSHYLRLEHLGKFCSLVASAVWELEGTLVIKIRVAQHFSACALLTFGVETFLLWGLPCTLQDVERHPFLYPVDVSSPSPLPLSSFVTTKNVSRLCQSSSGGKTAPHWESLV